jgi:hypothetical protein
LPVLLTRRKTVIGRRVSDFFSILKSRISWRGRLFRRSLMKFNFCQVCRMRSESGVVEQGALHAVSSLVASIVANLNIVAACFFSALFVSMLSPIEDGSGEIHALRFSRALKAGEGRLDGVVPIDVAADQMELNIFMRRFSSRAIVAPARADGRLPVAAAEAATFTRLSLPTLATGEGGMPADGRGYNISFPQPAAKVPRRLLSPAV